VAAANELFHERDAGLLVSSRFTGCVMLAYAAVVVLRSVLMAAGGGPPPCSHASFPR